MSSSTTFGNRRRFLAMFAVAAPGAVVLGACGSNEGSTATADASAAATSAALDKVTLALDWTPNTNHTGFYVADKKGYYADAGIKIDILPYGTTSPDQLVASKQADFGISGQTAVLFDVAQGMEVTSVLPITQKDATQMVFRSDSGWASPAALDGKTAGSSGLAWLDGLTKAVIKNAGGTGDYKKVTLPTDGVQAVIDKRVDFTTQLATWEGVQQQIEADPLAYFLFGDYGIPSNYMVTTIANPNWIAANGDLAKRFIAASVKGWDDTAKNPTESAQILIDANPSAFVDPKLPQQSQALMSADFLLDSAGTFGTQTASQWETYGSYLYKLGVVTDSDGAPLTSPPDYAAMFDASLLP